MNTTSFCGVLYFMSQETFLLNFFKKLNKTGRSVNTCTTTSTRTYERMVYIYYVPFFTITVIIYIVTSHLQQKVVECFDIYMVLLYL